uniref:Cytochrome P450 CYP9AG9 n=1 Tax=Chrysoperla zastrowi sillemi TaxID=482137 RepID=A0A9E7YFI0_9NEOP|nr:cytochrome P450 CYP9AG9 [Chrysoperla zastrowi sillemi]
MELTTWLLIGAVLYAIWAFLNRRLQYFESLNLPYVPGVPFFGSMASAVFRVCHISDTVKNIYRYNPEAKYIGAFDFMRPVIVLRDLDVIKNVTIKNFDNFPDHQAFIDDSVDPLFGGGLFNIAGERWKEARALLSPAFTSSKMKGMFELMVVCGKNFVDYLSKLPEKERKAIATKDMFGKLTNDVIGTCAFGININSLENPKNDFFILGKEATTFDGIMSLKFFIARSFPNVMKWFNIKFVSDRVERFFTSIVSTTIATRDEQGISRPDMIQLMMDARGKEGKNFKLDITSMTAQAFIFFFGGFDTTSTQMCIIAHELAINPDIQKRLQDEIDDVLERSKGKLTYEALNSMLYLDAIFNESMRFHPQAGFLDRLCVKAFELPPALPGLKPFVVQPGMNVWIPAVAIHRDPEYHDEPDTFNPDRYYQKKVTINDTQNLGFGIGPRSCIGNRFAIMETKLLFFFLLSKFNLVPNDKTCSPLVYSKKTFSLIPPGGYSLAIEPRTDASAYA